MIKYAGELGWEYVSPRDALRLRGGDTGLFFGDALESALLRLNPGVLDLARAGEVMRRLRLPRPDIGGNRDVLEWLRGEGSVFVPAERRERNVRLLDFADPAANTFTGDGRVDAARRAPRAQSRRRGLPGQRHPRGHRRDEAGRQAGRTCRGRGAGAALPPRDARAVAGSPAFRRHRAVQPVLRRHLEHRPQECLQLERGAAGPGQLRGAGQSLLRPRAPADRPARLHRLLCSATTPCSRSCCASTRRAPWSA